MCLICETKNIEDIKHITELDCYNCPWITEIPGELANLTKLYCQDCPILTEIPRELVNLKILYCYDNLSHFRRDVD